jgi:MFS family permease
MSSPRLWTKDFLVGTIANFLLLVNYFSLMVMTTDFTAETYGAPSGIAGLTASIFILGALFARIFVGTFLDRVGRRRMILGGVALEILCSASYLFIANAGLIGLITLRIAHGLAFGATQTALGTIVTSVIPDERKGEGIGYFMLSVTLGAAIGPSLGISVTESGGYSLIFIFAAIAAVICAVCLALMKVPEPNEPVDVTPMTQMHLDSFIEKGVVPISLVAGIIFFAYSSLLTFLSSFSQETGLQDAANYFFVVYAITMFVTRPFTGKAFDRHGHRVVLLPAFISFMVGMVLLGTSTTGVTMLIAAALLGFGLGTVQSCIFALAIQIAPDDHLSLANSTFYAIIDAGTGTGPLV